MTMVLVLNSGSSSVKFAVFDVLQGAAGAINPVCTGNASRLNEPGAGEFRLEWQGQKEQLDLPRNDHEGAIDTILSRVRQLGLLQQVAVVGHRVVHGGDRYRAPTRVDDKVLADIESFSAFAPLHNPPNLIGIRVCQQRLPAIPQVAVFDTAFHGTLPPVAYHYAIPQQWQQDWGVRRYGFHGISHHYIASQLPLLMPAPADGIRAVSAHLGNGCSLCAINNGISVDTSMGFTPLEGLMMGSRSGDLDPGLHEYLCEKLQTDIHGLTTLLNKDAGLKGVSGLSNDMRTCLQAADAGNAHAQLAVELFCYRLAKHIAACIVPLGRIDALVFTGGIGENAAPIRARVIALLAGLGFRLDTTLNAQRADHARNVATTSSPAIWIIPTQEEGMIARQSLALLNEEGCHS